MEFKNTIVDISHIFDHENFNETGSFNQNKIIFAQKKSNNFLFFLIKKEEALFRKAKKSFINKSEKSFELIHTSVVNILGFSVDKPYLYYKYVNNPRNINDIELSNENIQKMFLGIASGLSYLISKGYYYSEFTINSIVFDKNDCPKLVDYINFDDSNLMNEKDLIKAYAEIFNIVMDKKMKQDSETKINSTLMSLINRALKRDDELSFEDFINFFQRTSYCTNINFIMRTSFNSYLKNLDYTDIVLNDDDEYYTGDVLKTVEEYCMSLYNEKYEENFSKLYLNSVPEYRIRPLSAPDNFFSSSLMKFLYYEKFFNRSQNSYQQKSDNDFTMYLELMGEIEKKSISNYYNRMEYEHEIEEKRIQAIYYLKKSAENQHLTQAKIELAVQYIKGLILPYNLTKSLEILNSITSSDSQTINLINEMKKNINVKIQASSIGNLLQKLPPKGKKLLKEAENGNILSLLFVGFAFYTGFNKFPILRSLSIHYFRVAAKKSPYAMYHLGYLYFNGIFFPRNFKRARNCFKRAKDGNYIKAEILDGFLRKHLCRTYLLKFKIKNFLNNYHPTFKSMFPNDAYLFPRINYYLESNLNKSLIEVDFENFENEPYYENENCNMFLIEDRSENHSQLIKPAYSKKVLLSFDDSSEHDLSKEDLCKIAKNFFYGENNYPVNYSISLDYFKLAADKGDSEAQWRYAMMVDNSLGTKRDQKVVLKYFQDSARQNNIRGKFLYALYLKENHNINWFEQLISECCGLECLDAMYFYAMYLENVDKKLEKSMNYYQKAADGGHLDSLIKLIYILKYKSQTKLYEKYLNLSVSLFNEPLLVKLINFYDKNKKYDQSNILIELGINLNFPLFGAFYADHLLYGKGMPINIERAKKIVFHVYKDRYRLKDEYIERYQYIILDTLLLNNEQEKALTFLLKNGEKLSSNYRSKFLLIYQKLDKNIARDYYITINFCYEQYQECHSELMKLKKANNSNFIPIFDSLLSLAKCGNPYAMVIVGRLYKNGTHVIRNLKNAVQFFVCAAKQKCPEGYYYLGKEYYYGRILNQNFKKANSLLIKALKNNGEPRAGYYLYKIENIYIKDDDDDDVVFKDDDIDSSDTESEEDNEDVDAVKALIISSNFGYKRALYKYGHRLITGRDPRINMDEKKGENLIKQAAYQNHKKAIRYCKSHNISYIKNDDNSKLSDNKTNRKKSRNKSIDEDDSLSDINEANTNKKELNGSENDIVRPDLTNVYEDGKGSVSVNDENDERNSDSDSYDISELKFWS